MLDSIGNVLVVGANGLLGSALIELLCQNHGKATSITALDINTCKAKKEGVNYLVGDVRKLEDLLLATKNINTVFHTAAIVNFNPKNDDFMHAVNVGGTKNILLACEGNKVNRLVYTSSMDVVYEGKAIANGNESLLYPKKHVDFYSHTKMEAEQHILKTQSSVAKCAMRACGIYGPNDTIRFSVIVEAVKSGQYARIGKNDDAKYSHVFSYNCAYAHILGALHLHKDNHIDGEAYFITDESTDNFHRFVQKIVDRSGLSATNRSIPIWFAYAIAAISETWIKMPWVNKRTSPILTKNAITSLTKDLWFTSEKANKDFNYKALYNLEECIDQTADWIKKTYLSN